MRIIRILGVLTVTACLIVSANETHAAVGCELNDPDRDIKRAFTEATGYRTDFLSIKEMGGEVLRADLEKKLGDKFDDVYETIDVPYAYYSVLKGTNVIGLMHGVNQKGKYGGMQLIISTGLDGKIVHFYYQKISSPEAKKFRAEDFTKQFIGLTLQDFMDSASADGKIVKIKDPTDKSSEDFKSTIRGLKKNMLLLHEFVSKPKKSV